MKAVIQIIRNFTAEPMQLWLRRELLQSGITVECEFGGISTAAVEIDALQVHGTGTVASGECNTVRLNVLALCLETSASDFGHGTWKADEICQHHLDMIGHAIQRSAAPIVINTVLPPLFASAGLGETPGVPTHAARIEALNQEIRALAASHAGKVVLVDWAALARQFGEQGTYDYRFWFSSAAPFAQPFLARYAAAIAAVVRAISGRARKLLVLDCDQTIWGGILGEVGIDGICLSSDTLPGAYFHAFHRTILDLAARGVILALCSKNEEADVLEVLDRHPHCLIKRQHVAAWRIGWQSKDRSIVEICEELKVSLDSAVFVDDSPLECQMVAASLPEVRVLQTPKRPEDIVTFLQRNYLFDTLLVTNDDTARTASYQDNKAREGLRRELADLSDYRKRLETRIRVGQAAKSDLTRVAQLVQRTNQFNLTTRRHTLFELRTLHEDADAFIAICDVSDRFGDLGITGVAIARRLDPTTAALDSLMISCRALGRDVEHAFSIWLVRTLADQWGVTTFLAEYIRSPRNEPAAGFLDQIGFLREPESTEQHVRYHLHCDTAASSRFEPPEYISIEEIPDE